MPSMGIQQILVSIDAEIATLNKARTLLDGLRGVANTLKVAAPKKRRKMSAAGRKRIAEAQKKRWALLKKKKA
jgi:hypothetical protein